MHCKECNNACVGPDKWPETTPHKLTPDPHRKKADATVRWHAAEHVGATHAHTLPSAPIVRSSFCRFAATLIRARKERERESNLVKFGHKHTTQCQVTRNVSKHFWGLSRSATPYMAKRNGVATTSEGFHTHSTAHRSNPIRKPKVTIEPMRK